LLTSTGFLRVLEVINGYEISVIISETDTEDQLIVSPAALQQRYVAGMRDYMNCIVGQVRARVSGQQIDMDTYLSYRIGSSALRATYSMIE